MYDSIIIGSGPAGISASLYIKRANLNCLVIGKDKGSLAKANLIENYYGFENPINGETLFENGLKQAKTLGINIIKEEVLNIKFDKNFILETKNNKYESKTVLLATGMNRKNTPIKGIKEFEGRGISYCAVCDGFFFKNKNIAILGNEDYAINEAKELLNIAKSIKILTNGKELIQNREINIEEVNKKIDEFVGDEFIKEVRFNDNTSIKIDGIFIAEGTASSNDFARKLGAIVNDKYIIVDDNMQTNIQGLYAAGDCIGGIMQISKAVYEGTKAGLSIINFLRTK